MSHLRKVKKETFFNKYLITINEMSTFSLINVTHSQLLLLLNKYVSERNLGSTFVLTKKHF